MIMLTMLEMMVAVRAYAETHYEEGWDVVVEATDDEELAEDIGAATTVEEAIANVGRVVLLLEERREDVEGTKW